MTTLFVAKDTNDAKQLSKLCRAKKIRRICRGIYTNDLQTPLSEIAKKHWMPIVSHLIPGGILSFRTAFDLQPTPFQQSSIIFITSSYNKIVTLPGLTIKILKGNQHDYVEQVLLNLARSNTARLLLENLSIVRGAKYQSIKTIGKEAVENYLAKELRIRDENHLNKIRDDALVIAKSLKYMPAYKKLNEMISALLSTNPNEHCLKSAYAKSVAKKEPCDRHRIELFETLFLYLKKCQFKRRPYQYSKISFKNMAFFESYFSNYIEGTEFIIDEAEEIIFKGREIKNRHADSHDILAHFTLSNDFFEMAKTPSDPKELLTGLQERHAYLMKERPDKNPGLWKQKQNKAGNTVFVKPDEVIGTLCRGFEFYALLKDGIEKALFMQFMIGEVHPFEDGNGRLSRIMMNAELVHASQYKIIVPSVCRDNYLNGLRLASRDRDFRTYCKTMDQAQAYGESIDWLNYGDVREKIETDHANVTPDEGLPFFNRVLRLLKLSEFA